MRFGSGGVDLDAVVEAEHAQRAVAFPHDGIERRQQRGGLDLAGHRASRCRYAGLPQPGDRHLAHLALVDEPLQGVLRAGLLDAVVVGEVGEGADAVRDRRPLHELVLRLVFGHLARDDLGRQHLLGQRVGALEVRAPAGDDLAQSEHALEAALDVVPLPPRARGAARHRARSSMPAADPCRPARRAATPASSSFALSQSLSTRSK